MKQLYLRSLIASLAILVSICANAYDAYIDGIYYNFSGDEATVTYRYGYGSGNSNANAYSGNVVIPSTVTYLGSTYNVTSIRSSAFNDCSGLTSVNIPSSVTSIGSAAFYGCSGLTSVSIPSSVTSIRSSAFYGCRSLTSISIPSSVTSIGEHAFYKCSGLTSVSIPSSVTSIGSAAFRECSGLTSVNIPSSVTIIGDDTFSGCSGLTSISIPSSVTSIGSNAFSECSNLVVNVEGETPAKLGSNAYVGINNYTDYYVCINYIVVPANSIKAYEDAWSRYKSKIIPSEPITVNVTASSTSSSLHKAIGEDNLSSVRGLKIIGSINSYDIMILRNKMPSLKYLDMSETDIVASNYKYYDSYTTQDNVFPIYAFYGSTTPLVKVILPNSVTDIGAYAFCDCSGLTSVTFGDNLQSIGGSAFQGCSGLTSVTFGDNLQSIGGEAFYGCSGLTSVTFGDNLQSIGNYAFSGCSRLTSVTFGRRLKTIGQAAFSGTKLTEVKIPSSITYVGNYAFPSTITKVHAYTIEPTKIGQSTFESNSYSGTLYVPKTSYYNYYWDPQWSQFQNIVEEDCVYDNFHVDGDYELDKETGVVSGEPDIEINAGGGFVIEDNQGNKQKANEVVVNVSSSTSGSIITNNNITAKTFTANITVSSNLWYFITFPFDVDLKDVTCGGSYTFAQYNGSTRAANGKGGWQTVTSGRLEAGKGYIFQCNTANTLTLTVKNPKFKDTNISTTLNTYAAASTNNASWNFVGNPYPAYYGVRDLGFDAPITVWNRSKKTYEAYSVQDDDYVLSPFEAFFVQKPDATNAITFNADKRMTYNQAQEQKNAGARMRGASMEQESRKIVNLTINCGDESDKTRIVVNKNAQVGYEMECDAAKFISSDAAVQLYTVDADNIEYAINERPMETESVALGFIAKADGAYSISAQRMDVDMELCDNTTGETFNLADGDYNFTSKAGTFNKRFTLRIKDDTTGISELAKAGTEVKVTANGICINGNNADIFTTGGVNVATNAMGNVTLPAGCYIVKSNGVSSKVVVK